MDMTKTLAKKLLAESKGLAGPSVHNENAFFNAKLSKRRKRNKAAKLQRRKNRK